MAYTTADESSSLLTFSEASEPAYYVPKLPEVDYGRYEFKILKTDEVGSILYSNEFYVETENGEPINDAVYNRNRMVEEQLNIKITAIDYDKSTY